MSGGIKCSGDRRRARQEVCLIEIATVYIIGSWELIGRNTRTGLADRRAALDRLPSLTYVNLLVGVSDRSKPF